MERQLMAQRSQDRKKDTRQKIELGGLVVKAGLRNADKAFILGALVEAAARSQNDEDRAKLVALGKKAFEE